MDIQNLDLATQKAIYNQYQNTYKKNKIYDTKKYNADYYAKHKTNPEYVKQKNALANANYHKNKELKPKIVLSVLDKKQIIKQRNKEQYEIRKQKKIEAFNISNAEETKQINEILIRIDEQDEQ